MLTNRMLGRTLKETSLLLIILLILTSCSATISNTTEARNSVRKFSLNENMITQLAVGNRALACDYSEVLPQLLKQIGSKAIIYPSENYYYFSFNRGGSLFSGSIRLSSDRRNTGELDYVCYETNRSWVHRGSEIRVQKHLTSADGVSVKKVSALTYRIKYDGIETLFKLHKLDQKSPADTILLQDEIQLGRTQDESGAAFILIYNSKLNDFYFILDRSVSVPDVLIKLAPNTVISRRTGFVYYKKPENNRYILVAVNNQEVELNTYYDGPFDHLPENDYMEIEFWKYVYKVYPDLKGQHTPGGTMKDSGMIFSIVPYRLYDQVESLNFIETCAKNYPVEIEKISCMIWGET